MIGYLWWHFMNFLGYRKVLFLPSEKGLNIGDFYSWLYAPMIDKRNYTEKDFPFFMIGWRL